MHLSLVDCTHAGGGRPRQRGNGAGQGKDLHLPSVRPPPPQSGLPTSTLRTAVIRISAHVCRCFVEQALIIEPAFST